MPLFVRRSAILSVLTALSATFVVACAPARQGQGDAHDGPPGAPSPPPSSQMGTLDGGGGDTDRPSFEEIRTSVAQLVESQFYDQTLATVGRVYKDRYGKSYLDLPITASQDPELLKMLRILNRDLLGRRDSTNPRRWIFDFRESAPCISSDGERAASTKIDDLDSPICLSLPRIQKMTRRADLDHSMAALIMHELAHQHGADEKLAKKVERYFSLREVQNIEAMLAIGRAAGMARNYLSQLTTACSTEREKYINHSYIADTAVRVSTLLTNTIIATQSSGHKRSEKVRKAFEDLHLKFISIQMVCALNAETNSSAAIEVKIDSAKKAYDFATQELKKSTGLNVVNFSDVLCAYEKPEECDGI